MSQQAARQEKEKDNIIYFDPLLGNISQIGLKPPASIGWVWPKDHQMGPIFCGGSNIANLWWCLGMFRGFLL